jgi:hypothetical protein
MERETTRGAWGEVEHEVESKRRKERKREERGGEPRVVALALTSSVQRLV